MNNLESGLIWGSTIVYALTTMVFIYLVSFRKQKGERLALGLFVLAYVMHFAALAYRWAYTGHIPVKGHYENPAVSALFISTAALIVAFRKPTLRVVSFGATPLVLLVLGYGLMKFAKGSAMTPPLKSSWLVIHVAFAQLAYGAFSMACGAGIAYLLKERVATKGGEEGVLLSKLPGSERLDDLMFRFVVFGFITSAVMIVSGSFWANDLWGTYWNWDPVETWSLVTWLTYGVFIHLRVIHRWSGRKLAWLAIISILFVFLAYWGSEFMTSRYHMVIEGEM